MKHDKLAVWSVGRAWVVPAAIMALAAGCSSKSDNTAPKTSGATSHQAGIPSGCPDGSAVASAEGDAGGSGVIAAANDAGPDSGAASATDAGAVVSTSEAGAPTSDAAADASSTGPAAPPQAAAVGYTKSTFSSAFAKSGIDLGNTQKPGYQWYLGQYFGSPATDPGGITSNADGSITLNNGANIDSSSPSGSGWVGEAFGGGGYFEATFEFNPESVINGNTSQGWPAWWAMAVEHFAGLAGEQWPGQASGYDHFIETDFFEYDVWSFSPHNEYGGTVHDWYGQYAQTCGGGNYCNVSNASGGGTNFSNFQVQTPPSTDYTQYHAFGFLWVPATASTQGYGQFYFDGQATGNSVTWSQLGNESPPPGTAPWTFGILDSQHLGLVIGTGQNQPMTLKSVGVWQASDADNLLQ